MNSLKELARSGMAKIANEASNVDASEQKSTSDADPVLVEGLAFKAQMKKSFI